MYLCGCSRNLKVQVEFADAMQSNADILYHDKTISLSALFVFKTTYKWEKNIPARLYRIGISPLGVGFYTSETW